jgi:hypothetical protein
MSDDPRVVDPGHAPTPFTAAEIRTSCPEGRRATVRNVDSYTTSTVKVPQARLQIPTSGVVSNQLEGTPIRNDRIHSAADFGKKVSFRAVKGVVSVEVCLQ